MVLCTFEMFSFMSHVIRTLSSWRKLRKAAHMGLNLHAAEAYFPIQEREATLLVKSVLENPSDWDNHCQKYVSIFLRIQALNSNLLGLPRRRS